MRIRYISVPRLVAAAGGDPWVVDRTLQRGRPAQIASLAKAFHDAGQGTAEAEATFEEARRHFEAAWNRDGGEHPINDSAEVQRAAGSLGAQAAQLPKIAADLERVAAVLAEAQRASHGQIALLERRLEDVDRQLGEAYDLECSGGLSKAEEYRLIRLIGELEHLAIEDTAAALHVVEGIRDRYSIVLQRLTKKMREDGYDAAPVGGMDAHVFETPEQAERDVHAALAGDQQAASRLNGVLDSITDGQRAGKEPLTDEQAAVLSQLQAQQHGMSISELRTTYDSLGDQGRVLANSWQLMSDPAISFPRSELVPGAKQGDESVKGSVLQLPQSLLTLDCMPTGPLQLIRLEQITTIAKAGDPRFRTNTGFDALMLGKASAMLQQGLDGAEDGVVANIFALVSPDHQVVHNTLSGFDGDRFLRDVTQHAWSDHGKGAASLFDWIEGAARGPEAQLAGETARAYGLYIGTHSSELLHLPGSHSLGDVNPELVRSMAHGLTPYIGNIAGVPGGVPEFGCSPDGLDAIENGQMPIAKGIFSVLSTEQAASSYFNGAAEHQALLAEGAYARDLTSHAPNLNSYNTSLGHAMTLRGLVDTGIHNAVQADVGNHKIAQDAASHAEYDRRRIAYESGAKILTTAAMSLPYGTVPGLAINVFAGAVENDVLGPAPLASAPNQSGPPLLTVGRADREILDAILASGQHIPVPEAYIVDGHIGTPDEIARVVSGLTADEYDHVLNQALTDLYAQNYGNDRVAAVPDQHMMNRYNAVIANPTPGPSR